MYLAAQIKKTEFFLCSITGLVPIPLCADVAVGSAGRLAAAIPQSPEEINKKVGGRKREEGVQ